VEDMKIVLINREYIEITEDVEFYIIPTSSHDTINYRYNTRISIPEEEDQTGFDMQSFQINGEEKNIEISKYKTNGYLVVRYAIELRGCEKYIVRRVVKKIYSLIYNPTKGFRTRRFVKGLHVRISYPQSLQIELRESGTIEEFKKHGVIHENHIDREYAGLLFPMQGYRLFLYLQ